ncbi:DUF38 domain-containing protein [Caenorhabditis elegans]|uniref:DUF38 domain-containing protein n=1 Tax=Caenorhabditis elegans TaxID=6239 RepID=Q9U384_CAEEL|nr:DUF38 domain-containing protein [Caenorhabditis elegans]CAB04646.3 DUF38 domain-containing protein [Caenorhabditis elegans]|eukprot:NP_507572.2 Uncharacterized protein CELE_R10E8.6 [Caenorhabditis elegans]
MDNLFRRLSQLLFRFERKTRALAHSKILTSTLKRLQNSTRIGIRITVSICTIRLTIYTRSTPSRVTIVYQEDGWIVSDNKKELIDNFDYFFVFMRHLHSIFASKIPVSYISIQFICDLRARLISETTDEHTEMLFLKELSEMMESRNQNVKLKRFSVHFHGVTLNNSIEPILQHVEAKVLVLKANCDEDMKYDFNKIVETNIWKSARVVDIDSLYLSHAHKFSCQPVEEISHFSSVSCIFYSINFDDMVFLKEHFLESPNAREFLISYRKFDEQPMISDIYEMGLDTIFGKPVNVEYKEEDKIYKFRVMDTEHDISIQLFLRRSGNSSIIFTREPPSVKQIYDQTVHNYHSHTIDLLERNGQETNALLVIRNDSILIYFTYTDKNTAEKKVENFEYKSLETGCSAVVSERRTSLTVNLDHMSLFLTHLKYLLDNLTTFESFSFGFNEESCDAEFMNRLNKTIPSNSLKADGCCISFNRHPLITDYITSVLSYFQPGTLENIAIHTAPHTIAMELEDIAGLEQWKRAISVAMCNTTLKLSSKSWENFKHFSCATIISEPISFEDLSFLKEHFLTSNTPRQIKLQYLRSSEDNINVAQKLLELFGPPAHESYESAKQCDRTWCIAISNQDNCFLVKHKFCRPREYGTFVFSRKLAAEMEWINSSPSRSQILSAFIKCLATYKNHSLEVHTAEDQVRIMFSYSSELTSYRKNIVYKNHREGCLLEFDVHKIVIDEDYVTVSCEDLNMVLETVESIDTLLIESEEISPSRSDDDPNNSNETVFGCCLTKLVENLKQRKQMLHVRNFRLNLNMQSPSDQVYSILELLSPEVVELKTSIEDTKLELSEINFTKTKELKAESFLLSIPIKLLSKFSKVAVTLQDFSVEDLVYLKEHLLGSPTPFKFTINDNRSKEEHVNAKNLLEEFGTPDRIQDDLMEWRIRIPGPKFDLLIEYRPCVPMGQSFSFERVVERVEEHQRHEFTNQPIELPLSYTTHSLILPSTLNTTKAFKLAEVRLSLYSTSITVGLYCTLQGQRSSRIHEYQHHPNGCRLQCDHQREMVRNRDFVSLAVSHLKTILEGQNVILEFSVHLCDDSEYIDKRCLEDLVEMLRSRRRQLKVRNFKISFFEQPYIKIAASLLSYFDHFSLVRITLNTPLHGTVIETEDCDLLVSLDQWHCASELLISSFVFSTALENFENFSLASVTVPTISFEQLALLKENLTYSTTKFCLVINFHGYEDEDSNDVEARRPQEIFGEPNVEYGSEEFGHKNWHLPMDDREYRLAIRYQHCGAEGIPAYVFTREKQEDAPPFDMLRLVTCFPMVMKNIVDNCAFVSVEVLRKVCKDLRYFVDRSRSKSKFQTNDIAVSLNSDDLKLRIRQSNAHTLFVYYKQPIGCRLDIIELTPDGATRNYREHHLTDDTPLNYLMRDLQFVLKDQKNCLRSFHYWVAGEHEEAQEKLKRVLIRSSKLQVKCLILAGRTESEILELLECFDAGKLKLLRLDFAKITEEDEGTLEIARIAETGHWRTAEEFVVAECVLNTDPLNFNQLFGNFKSQKVCLQNFTVDNLLFMKQKSLSTSIKLFFICENFDMENLYELIGRPLLVTEDAVKVRKWFFKLIGTLEHVLLLRINTENGKIHVQMFRIPVSYVPQNATIRDD